MRPTAGPVFHHRSPDDVVAVIGDYIPSTSDALFGHTSLAAARVLLESDGNCTGCERQLDLTREDARDRVHIHTADPPPQEPELEHTDWPAALCDSCQDRMRRDRFTSFLDFRFALHPRCPSCSAQRSMSTMYGKPIGPVEDPGLRRWAASYSPGSGSAGRAATSGSRWRSGLCAAREGLTPICGSGSITGSGHLCIDNAARCSGWSSPCSSFCF